VIYAIARMTIPLKKLDEALEILTSVMERARFESGCVSCNVFQDADSRNLVTIEEVWDTEEDLARHLRSGEYQKILLVAEMASAPPEIKFYTVQEARGFETVERARKVLRGEKT
jgi:quinol monooxygenase YgiN